MLLIVTSIKLIAEIAMLALLGQWIVGLIAGAKRDSNLIYRLLAVIGGPFLTLARRLSPAVVLDRHVPLVAALLLALLWLAATAAKIRLCLAIGVEMCR